MMRRFLLVFAVLALVSMLSGCVRGPAFGVGMLLGMAIANPYPPVVVVHEEVVPADFSYVSPDGEPSARSGDLDERPRGIDTNAARASLHRADAEVAACNALGAPRGYGHAKVTFRPQGSVTRVAIDDPRGLSPDVVACIGDALGRATVPPFEGRDVNVGIRWFVP